MEIEVINYIKEAQKHGLSEQEIKKNLLEAGWEAQIVEDSLSHVRATKGQSTANADEDMTMPKTQSQHNAQNTAINVLNTHKVVFKSSSVVEPAQISEQHFSQEVSKPNGFKKFLVPIVVSLLFLIAATSGFAYYKLIFQKQKPENVWNLFLSSNKQEVFKYNFSLKYADKHSIEKTQSTFPKFSYSNFGLEAEGNAYEDNTDLKNPTAEIKLSNTIKSGDTSLKIGYDFKILNNIFYFKIGDNMFLNSIVNNDPTKPKIDWLSFDFAKAQNSNAAQTEKRLKNIFSDSLKKEIEKLRNNTKIITIESVLGIENINGIKVMHFKNNFDKESFKGFIKEITKLVFDSANSNSPDLKFGNEDLKNAEKIIDTISNKIQVNSIETWIGISDGQLYRVKFASNAPSFARILETALSSFESKNRDARRYNDIMGISSALELYYNDFGGYPEAKEGVPVGLSPDYILSFPVAPKPADGGCSEFYNNYWYETAGKKTVSKGKPIYSEYKFSFCLGGEISVFKAGLANLTPQGITDGIECPSENKRCLSIQKNLSENFLESLNFDAEFSADFSYYDYGKKTEVKPPENFTSVFDLVSNLVKDIKIER